MALPFFNWSRTAASNATADSTVNWAEGQPPSSVNDSARAMMASTAAFRDDTAGAIVSTGSSTAYAVTSYQVFDTLAHMNGQMIAFTPHATNGATVTLNVDGLGAKPLRPSPGVELAAGTLILGTPYTCTYNNSDAVWYLNGAGGAYGTPLGGGMIYFGAIAPNSSFVFPYGQQISQTTYAALYAVFGVNAYGADGGGLFYLPDLRGRVPAGKDNMGGSAASRLTSTYFGASASTLGAVGGSESHTLTTAQLASHQHTGTTNAADRSLDHTHGYTAPVNASSTTGGGAFPIVGSVTSLASAANSISLDHLHTFTTAAAGSGGAHNNTQPTIVCNYIIRVL